MDNLVDIIESIISKIDLNIKVKSITGNKVYLCGNTLHLTITKIVTIGGKQYTITDFVANDWIEVMPLGHEDDLVGDEEFVIAPGITFIQGDPENANSEYLQLDSETLAKTPFIWLLEGYEFDRLPRDSSVEAEFNPKLFFLDWANETEWKSKAHNDRVIKPMQNLLDAFIDVVNEDFNFKTLGKVKGVVRPRFGVNVRQNGQYEKPKMKIIDEDLSGIEARPKLEVYDVSACECL